MLARYVFPGVAIILAGCSANTRMAPIEGRQDGTAVPVGIEATRPPARPPAPAPAPGAPQVFALPDAEAAPMAPVPVPDGGSMTPLPPVPPPADPALRELVAQADQAAARGDRGAARSTLERALKIKPGDAQLWLRLGELNFADGEYEQAMVMAQRARELAHGDAALVAQSNALITRAGQQLTR